MQKLFSFFIALFIGCSSIAQVNLDSLWGVWDDKTQPDTSRLKAIKSISWDGYLLSQPDSAFYFAGLMYDFAVSVNNKIQQADALNTQGVSLSIRDNYEEGLICFKKGLKISKDIGYKQGISIALLNIGLIYKDQDNNEEALVYHKKSLRISEEIGDQTNSVRLCLCCCICHFQ